MSLSAALSILLLHSSLDGETGDYDSTGMLLLYVEHIGYTD